MVSDARITPSARVEKIFRKRGVRNQSGIAVISLLTKFWGCPGKCIYCPTFVGLPRSYIPDEPAVMRAEMNEFDPVKIPNTDLMYQSQKWFFGHVLGNDNILTSASGNTRQIAKFGASFNPGRTALLEIEMDFSQIKFSDHVHIPVHAPFTF